MCLITKEVEITLSGNNIKWYEDKGYKIPKYKDSKEKYSVKRGTKTIVKVEDLPDGSTTKIDVECDGCGRVLKNIIWQNYKKYIHKDGKYYCCLCVKNNCKKYMSFYNWCYKNLPKEEADEIMTRWDYNKNVKNGKILSPKDVSYRSDGLNGKGYWLKCLDNSKHKSEQKRISDFTKYKGSIDCKQCNSIAEKHPELIKYFVCKKDAYNYSIGTENRIKIKCPNCGLVKKVMPYSIIKYGFRCDRCSDRLSYPEKFIFSLLEQLINSKFIYQLTKVTFKWCGNYRYDFYIDEIKCIIETHGLQHYKQTTGNWELLEKIQENDRKKEQLTKENNIKNYIILDCRESNLEWIKKSVMNSELPKLLKFKEKDIDWLKCHEYTCSSLVKKVCNLWNSGIRNTNEISSKINFGRNAVTKYLKQGAKLGWCNYDPQKELENNMNNFKLKISKKVICLTTGEIYNSQIEVANKYNINSSGVSACCKGRIKSSGKHPITGEKLIWMYYDEYIKEQNNT